MALLAQGKEILADDSPALSDHSFNRVDTRTPPHLLPPGVVADAQNQRFEDGRAWPRYNIDQQAWGIPLWVNVIAAGTQYGVEGGIVVQLVPGQTYFYIPGNSTQLQAHAIINGNRENINIAPGEFVALANATYSLFGMNGQVVTAEMLSARPCNVCGYKRFEDPDGIDTTVVLTDDWRDQAGEDGGRGRAWRIVSGNVPQQIPMNGNDIYGIARLIPCKDGLVMLRQDNERHYFQAAAVGVPGASKITLNCQPEWNNGDQVQLVGDPTLNSGFTGGSWPGSGAYCYVKNLGSNEVELYQDPGLVHPYTFTGAIGRFYLERDAEFPGFGGNGAPPLLCQPGAAGQLMWDEGFLEVPAQVFVTAQSDSGGGAVANLVTAANHRLSPGDTINYFPATANGQITGAPSNGATTWYACPVGPQALYIYTTLNDALADTGQNYANLPAFAAGQFIVKTTASGQPMPPGREGFYTEQGVLVIVNGRNNLFISLPEDPLHYIPLSDQVTADLGEADEVTAVAQVPDTDALIIFKERSVMALYNFAEGLANNGESWTLLSVTREYGCLAPLSLTQAGASLYFLSRRGIDVINVNAFGTVLPEKAPLSENQSAYIAQIGWQYAGQTCAESWNNRVLFALPANGQAAGAAGVLTNAIVGGPQNNLVLSLNLLNTNDGTIGWEGQWSGFSVYGFARLTIGGFGERLTYCDYAGNVNWLSDGFYDFTDEPIATRLLTRRYVGTGVGRKVFNTALVIWDSYGAEPTVAAVAPGVGRSYPLKYTGYNNQDYLQGANVPILYNPQTQVPPFNAPFRADYTPDGLVDAMNQVLEQHQNISQPFRLRVDTWGIQLDIRNAAGSLRVAATQVGAIQGPNNLRVRT